MYGLTVNQFIKIARCKRSLKLQGQQFTPFCANMTATFIPRALPDLSRSNQNSITPLGVATCMTASTMIYMYTRSSIHIIVEGGG